MSKEKIITKKVWAPTIAAMDKLDEIEKADDIVIQALTRSVGILQSNEMESKIKDVVTKAASKTDKVIISSIVGREDDLEINMKAEVLNASLKFMFLNDPKVIICDNSNLRDKKFRDRDGLHLTTHGTSVLANNRKYKIAEGLKIPVVRKSIHNFRTENRNSRDRDARYYKPQYHHGRMFNEYGSPGEFGGNWL